MFLATLMAAFPAANSPEGNIDSNSRAEDIFLLEGVQYITDMNCVSEELKSFMDDGGIVAVIHSGTVETAATAAIEECLEIPFSVGTNMDGQGAKIDLGKDLATLYYHYGKDCSGIYVINVGMNDSVSQDELIYEAVSVIRERQTHYASDSTASAEENEAKAIGIIDVIATREPKGKLNASYKVFTVQNHLDRDYYIVKAVLTGMPGCVLTNSSSRYERKYQGEHMYASLSSPTSSVTVDAFGPHRTIGSGSYTVDIGGSWSELGGVTIEGGISWTRNIADTTIEASCTPNTATWDVTLIDSAQETSFCFEPGTSFDCPSAKTSVDISVSASYTVDSWDTFAEAITLNRTIRCTSQSAAEQ